MANPSPRRKRKRNREGGLPIERPRLTAQPRQVVQQVEIQESGPIPAPNTLKGYGEVDPTFPQRIMNMAEREQSHRHDLEHQVVEAQKDDLKRDRMEARPGQIFALVIGLAAIIGGVVAAVMGAQWTGSIIGGGGVIGLVAVFIKGRQYATTPEKPKEK